MDVSLVLFFVLAFAAIGGAVFMLNLYKVVHMVVSLAFTFLALAGMYLMLEAEFVAFAQVMIYTGAITILMLYGIMLTRHDLLELQVQRLGHQIWTALGVAGLFLFLFFAIMDSPWPGPGGEMLAEHNVAAIGESLFTHYVIPFELASVLLLVALVGAVVLARREEQEE